MVHGRVFGEEAVQNGTQEKRPASLEIALIEGDRNLDAAGGRNAGPVADTPDDSLTVDAPNTGNFPV